MTYQQTIDFLYQQLPMFSRIGAAAYKEDLTNTIALCKAINNPQNSFKSIHIAGTNGKGSTSHMLAAILQTAGLKVGLYTSPHLYDFRERIKVNGQMCSEGFVVDFVKKIKPLLSEIQPSFFEMTVAMAFEYFAQQKIDIAVIETGLGGRLDSTNIITPVLSIITNIGYDHTNLLGNTLQEISYEKAGIIKPNIPVVIGEYLPETKQVFIDKAKQSNSPIYFAQDNVVVEKTKVDEDYLTIILDTKNQKPNEYQTDLTGLYQIKNIVTVLESCNQLNNLGFKITTNNIQTALKNVQTLTGFQGRWQQLRKNPTIIADVAHNVDGIKQIIHQLENTDYKNLHMVIGMVKDKDITNVLKLLPQKGTYYFTQAKIERALPAEALKQQADEFLLHGDWYGNVNDAIAEAKKAADKNDLILVCGSFFIISEIDKKLL